MPRWKLGLKGEAELPFCQVRPYLYILIPFLKLRMKSLHMKMKKFEIKILVEVLALPHQHDLSVSLQICQMTSKVFVVWL